MTTENPSSKPWLIYGLLLLVMVLYALSFSQSAIVLDTARDLSAAWQISQGEHFPLQGPDIGGRFHNGPLWFYFLAIPALTGSLWFVSFWVGLFVALKFVFAYQLGRAVLDERLGLMWAVFLLLPGWHSLSSMVITHTSLIETWCLFYLLMLYRFHQTTQLKFWFGAALGMALGFQAHPTFLAMGLFYVPVMWAHRSQLRLGMLLAAALILLLPLLPYLLAQMMQGFPDWARLSGHQKITDQLQATGQAVAERSWLMHWLENLWAVVIEGPRRLLNFVSSHLNQSIGAWGALLSWVWYSVLALGVAGCLLTWWRMPAIRRLLGVMLSGWLVALLLITLMRSFTPYYMVLVLMPLWLGLLALGGYAATDVIAGKHNRWFFGGLLTVILITAWVPFAAWYQATVYGQANLGPVMNITPKAVIDWPQQPALDALTVRDAQAVSSIYCGGPMVINGPMAAVVDITSGATLDFSCTDYQVSLGGGGQGKLLLHRSMLSAAGILPDQWLGTAWGQLVVFQNFNQAAGLPDSGLETAPFNPAVHPPRMGQQPGALQTLPISMNQTSANYLLITNIMPTYRQFQVSGVQANGQPATLLVANAANRLYHCRHCQSGTINWQFELTTNDVSAIDINGFSHDRP